MRWVLLLYSLFCFLVAGGLLFKRPHKPTALLGVFALMFGLEIADFLYSTSQLKSLYPQYYAYYYLPAGFLYGPLLFWYFRYNLEKEYQFSLWELAHLIPFAAVLFYLWPIFTMPAPERMVFISEHFTDVIMPVNYARALHLFSYGLALVLYLSKNGRWLNPRNRLYAWSVVLIYFISCVVISWLTQFASSWRDFDLYYLLSCNIILVIGILLYTDPAFLQLIAQKYLKSGISKKDKKRIRKKVEAAFADKKTFARNDLSLTVLEGLIGEKKHHISQTFSEEIQESFHAYVNRHRVEYAKELISDPEYQKYTLEAIGQKAGFNNRVSFIKAFRKHNAQTPSEYQKAQNAS